MKIIVSATCAILLLITGSVVYAAPTAEVWNGPKMILGLPACDGRTDDSNTLIIKNSGEEVGHYHLCATAIIGNAKLITDRNSKDYVLLHYVTGHGTADVAVEHLTVFQVPSVPKKHDLVPYLTLITSASAGPRSRWTYRYKVEKLPCGGLRLIFTREISGYDLNKGHPIIEALPGEEVRTIDVGAPIRCRSNESRS